MAMTEPTQQNGNRLRLLGWTLAAGLVVVLAAAMLLSDDVDWTPRDFAAAGLMLGALGLGIEGAVRAAGSMRWRLGAITALLLAFALVWVNLAVGLVGAEGGPINNALLAVPFALVAGVWLSRPARH